MPASAASRTVTVTCQPAGAELLFLRLMGSDELGRLSRYQIDILSTSNDIKPSAVLGQDMSVSLALPAGGTREFNGIVTQFRMTSAGSQQYGSMARRQEIAGIWRGGARLPKAPPTPVPEAGRRCRGRPPRWPGIPFRICP